MVIIYFTVFLYPGTAVAIIKGNNNETETLEKHILL